jgi:hypothetical protein
MISNTSSYVWNAIGAGTAVREGQDDWHGGIRTMSRWVP